ncbi:MAG: N-succinylarginine dihydrolase [Legionellaceae bacterium]|nr:N-succinylarginine dihydrolase [Legionellaceae bacterium]
MVYELNLDGLVGPTHHYAGLAFGNKASMRHADTQSNPRDAALQGLKKMRLLHELGLKQAVLPPQLRPNLQFLHTLGFTGSVSYQLEQAKKHHPRALSAAFSASSMWCANAATVTPSSDTTDKRVHFTAANLVHHLHRHQEADTNKVMLETIFSNNAHFVHHDVLPKTPDYNDEGAANHNRFAKTHVSSGIHLFVYGREASKIDAPPTHFPARHTKEASEAIATKHTLAPEQTLFAAQHPNAIDAGVFHNDVISLANESVFLVHEDAFLNQKVLLEQLQQRADFDISLIEIQRETLSLEAAVESYLFNAQLVTLPSNAGMALIAPTECHSNLAVRRVVDNIIADKKNPICAVHYVSLKQSMQNGGGPACLRLRIPLTQTELSAMHQGILITDDLLNALEAHIHTYYRTELSFQDLTDPALVDETMSAHEALLKLLKL